MKRKLLFSVIIIFLFQISPVRSQIPQYTLVAKNFTLVNEINEFGGYTIKFDLVFTHTNATVMQLAGWQFFFRLPQTFGNLSLGTATASSFMLDSNAGVGVSDLPVGFRPRHGSVVIASNSPGNYELRLAANSLPGCGNGLIFPQGVPVLIGRYNIKASSSINLNALSGFMIRDSCESPLSVTRTKINWYDANDCLNKEMTRCASHSVAVDISPIPILFTMNLKIVPEGLFNSATDKLFRKDSVTLYLRNINSPYQIIDSSKAVIDSVNLSSVFNSSIIQTGNYYFSVKTRNTLETWCKSGGITINQGVNNYDMTTSASQAYGSNMVLKGSRYCIYSGNVNNDQIIDSDDLSMIENDVYNFVLGNGVTNLNGDNIVDIDDMAIVDRNAENLRLVEWPGLTLEMRNKLLIKKNISGGNK